MLTQTHIWASAHTHVYTHTYICASPRARTHTHTLACMHKFSWKSTGAIHVATWANITGLHHHLLAARHALPVAPLVPPSHTPTNTHQLFGTVTGSADSVGNEFTQ